MRQVTLCSTDAVVPKNARDFKEIGDFGDLWRELDDGYGIEKSFDSASTQRHYPRAGQSKWVAEQMIIRSSARGLPAFIYRLGTRVFGCLCAKCTLL